MEEGDVCGDNATPNLTFLPIPLEEVKYRLTRNKPLDMIERRATLSEMNPSRTIYTDSPTKDYVFRQEIHRTAERELSESFISEYLTPNETVDNNGSRVASEICITPCESLQNSDNKMLLEPGKPIINVNDDNQGFIENVAKVLDLSSCSSQYASAFECSQFNNHQDKASLTTISNNCYRQSEYLDNIKDTILVSSDDDGDHENSSKFSKNSIDGCVLKPPCGSNIDSSLIYISSDPESSIEEEVDRKSEVHELLQRFGLNNIDNPVIPEISFKLPLDNLNNSEVLPSLSSSLEDSSYRESSIEEEIERITEDNLRLSLNNIDNPIVIETTNVNLNNSEVPAEIPSCSTSLQDSFEYGLDDTIAEMEMALKYGLDYTMPDEKSDTYKTDLNQENVDKSPIHINQFIAAPSTSEPKLRHCDKYKKTLIPVKNPVIILQPKSITPVKDDFNFKMPPKPVAFRKSPDFKNVVSPVAVYIKNSPRVPLVQHIPAKLFTPNSRFAKTTNISNKENEELPFCVYKPAKHAVEEAAAKEIKLPPTLQKYVPTIPTVIKHHGRMAQKVSNPAAVEQKLLMEDITMCDGDTTFSDSSSSLQDVSYRTSKKAFIN